MRKQTHARVRGDTGGMTGWDIGGKQTSADRLVRADDMTSQAKASPTSAGCLLFSGREKPGKNNLQKWDVGCLMVHLSHSPLANNTALQSIAWRVSHDALRRSPNLMCKSLCRTFTKPKEPTSDSTPVRVDTLQWDSVWF